MLKNVYAPLSGAIAQERAIESIANNLANVNTVGFKGDSVTFTLQESEPYRNYKSPIPPANYKVGFKDIQYLIGNEQMYSGVASLKRDPVQGPAIETKNPTDLMIEGEGFFEVNTAQGIRFTRAGNMSIAPDGALVTKQGDPYLGEKGVIYVRGQFEVNQRGEIIQDGNIVDKLRVFKFSNQDLIERVGQNYVLYDGDEQGIQKVGSPSIRQGFLEGSNVNAIKSLTSMILAHRSYEAYQKAVKNYDSMMEKSSNTIGAVRI